MMFQKRTFHQGLEKKKRGGKNRKQTIAPAEGTVAPARAVGGKKEQRAEACRNRCLSLRRRKGKKGVLVEIAPGNFTSREKIVIVINTKVIWLPVGHRQVRRKFP